MKKTYYYNLDFLKIIFTIIVILYHFIRKLGFFCEGGYAVEMFFLISGFLCASTFHKDLSTLNFTKKKLAYVMPFLMVAMMEFAPFSFHSVKAIFNSLFLVPVFNYDLFLPIAWYINVWFWISLCLFYMTKNFKKEYVIFFVGVSVFISVAQMLSSNLWLTWQKIGFLNAGFFRGIAAMGMGYLLFNVTPPRKVPTI